MINPAKTYPLTIYLIKKEFIPENCVSKKDLNHRNIENVGDFYYKDSKGKRPKWSDLFEGYDFPLYSASASGLLIVRIRDRFLAVAFGPEGRHYIVKGSTEERFGLITTLNSVKEDSIRSIDTKTLESEGIQTRIQSTRPVSADVFGFDVERDLLRSAAGESSDNRLGKTLAGKDSFRASVKCDLNILNEYLEIILDKYLSNKYKKKFPWVDNLRQIEDPLKVEELNNKLVDEINNESPKKVWITVPDILDWTDHGGFKYSTRTGEPLRDDIHINTLKDALNKSIKLEDLKDGNIYRFSVSNDYTTDHWKIYECIYFEYSMSDQTYFLASGKWYSVGNNLVADVNKYYENVSSNTHGVKFQEYSHKNENKYNLELATLNDALCLDRKMITIAGSSSFEFSDIYTKNKVIIHVKRYSGSSALSHLFNQGLVSANFLLDYEFRQKINDQLLKKDFAIQDVSKRPNIVNGEYKIIYGVISKTDSPLDIPFFSKLTLMHVSKSLTNLGYDISLIKIKNLKPDINDY